MVGLLKSSSDFKPVRLTLLSLLFASMMMLMGGAALAPALPTISAEFPDQSEFIISLIVTLPSLAIAMTGIFIGSLADRYGKVKVLIISLIIFSVAGVSGYFQNDMGAILAGRFLVGVGIAGLTCSCTALLSEYYSGPARIKVLGYQAAAMGIGGLVLEISGGLLAGIGWRLPFLIYGLGSLVTLLVIVSTREPARDPHHEGMEAAKRADPWKVALGYISIFLAMFLMFAIPTKMAYYISEIGGGPALIGVFLGINGISSAATSVLYRRLSDRFDILTMLTMAFCLFTIGFAVFLLPPSLAIAFIGVSCVGLAVGLVLPTVTSTLAKESTRMTSGKIMGGFTMMFYLGQFLSTVILTPILVAAGSYSGMFVYLAGISGAAAIAMAMLLVRSRPAPANNAPSISPKAAYMRILVATDGSENNVAAIEHGIALARATNAEITFLCALDVDPYLTGLTATTESAKAALDGAAQASEDAVQRALKRCDDARVAAKGLVLTGSAADVITTASTDYDLIVMGTLGRAGIAHAMIGSVAERVVHSSKCPVLVVPGSAHPSRRPGTVARPVSNGQRTVTEDHA
jgi:MFS family permease